MSFEITNTADLFRRVSQLEESLKAQTTANKELKQRLDVAEKTCSEMAKKVGQSSGVTPCFASVLSKEMKKTIFNESVDTRTGERRESNCYEVKIKFDNFYKNLLLVCGHTFVYKTPSSGKYCLKALTADKFDEKELQRFLIFLEKILLLICEYRKNKEN